MVTPAFCELTKSSFTKMSKLRDIRHQVICLLSKIICVSRSNLQTVGNRVNRGGESRDQQNARGKSNAQPE